MKKCLAFVVLFLACGCQREQVAEDVPSTTPLEKPPIELESVAVEGMEPSAGVTPGVVVYWFSGNATLGFIVLHTHSRQSKGRLGQGIG